MVLMRRTLSDERNQIDALDGLRGLAVLIVFLSHTSLRDWHLVPGFDLRGFGKAGVYLFFVLSAFLLSRNISYKRYNIFGRSNIINYALRRFLRIYPLYATYLFSGVVFFYFLRIDNITPHMNLESAFRHFMLLEGDFIAWSIPVEFKYYFILPLLTWFFLYLHGLKKYIGLISYLLLILSVSFLFPQAESNTNDIRTVYYLSLFLTGSYLGVVSTRSAIELSEFKRYSTLILICIFISLCAANPATVEFIKKEPIPNNYSHAWHVYFAFLWGLLILCAVHGDRYISILLSNATLRYLGLISFSFYLWHYTVIFIVDACFKEFAPVVKAWLSMGLTICISSLTYILIERPLSRYRAFKQASIRG